MIIQRCDKTLPFLCLERTGHTGSPADKDTSHHSCEWFSTWGRRSPTRPWEVLLRFLNNMTKSLVTLEMIPAGDSIKTAIIVLNSTIIWIIKATIISTNISLCTVSRPMTQWKSNLLIPGLKVKVWLGLNWFRFLLHEILKRLILSQLRHYNPFHTGQRTDWHTPSSGFCLQWEMTQMFIGSTSSQHMHTLIFLMLWRVLNFQTFEHSNIVQVAKERGKLGKTGNGKGVDPQILPDLPAF